MYKAQRKTSLSNGEVEIKWKLPTFFKREKKIPATELYLLFPPITHVFNG